MKATITLNLNNLHRHLSEVEIKNAVQYIMGGSYDYPYCVSKHRGVSWELKACLSKLILTIDSKDSRSPILSSIQDCLGSLVFQAFIRSGEVSNYETSDPSLKWYEANNVITEEVEDVDYAISTDGSVSKDVETTTRKIKTVYSFLNDFYVEVEFRRGIESSIEENPYLIEYYDKVGWPVLDDYHKNTIIQNAVFDSIKNCHNEFNLISLTNSLKELRSSVSEEDFNLALSMSRE